MSLEINNLYEFGSFRLDAQERTLQRSNGEYVALSPKVFETLFLLVRRHGSIVSKSEMMNALWTDSFVEESNLTQNIYVLRRVLGTDEDGKNFIENIPRRGYRFGAKVRLTPKAESDEMTNNVSPENQKEFLSDYINPTASVKENAAELSADEEKNENATFDLSKLESKDEKPKARKSAVNRSFFYVYLLIAVSASVFLSFLGLRFISGRSDAKNFAPNEAVNFQKLTYTGDLTFPSLAPDGNSFAYVRAGGLFVQDINSGGEIRLNVAGASVFGILKFSPDGEAIYFRSQTGFDLAASIFRVSRYGGEPQIVAENVWSGFDFSPDAREMVFVRANPNEAEGALIVKNLETGAERNLAILKLPNEFLGNGHPAWSPDGKKIAAVIFKKLQTTPVSSLVMIDAQTGEIEEINEPQLRQFEQIAWLPDGSGLIVSAREAGKFFQVWRLDYPSGNIQKITNDLNIYRGISLSKDGKKMLARQFTLYSHLWIADKNDLAGAHQKTSGNLNRDGVFGMTWTPNGDILYVARIMGDNDLWLYRPADNSRRQLTKNAGDLHQYPVISPDGTTIFFNSNQSGANHIWRMDASGASQAQVTFSETDIEIHPQISPDGAWLYYIQKNAHASIVRRKSLLDEKNEMLTEEGKFAPDSFLSLSPDGKLLAFHNRREKLSEDGEKQIYQIAVIPTDRQSAASAKFFDLAASRLNVRWTSDGTGLDYIENDSEDARIWRQSLDSRRPPTLVVSLPKAFLHNFAWSADGEKLALSRGQQLNDAILLTNFQP